MTARRDDVGARRGVVPSASRTTGIWPLNRNHEAARRRVNQILRDHGRPDYSRRETQIAELLEEFVRERDELRAIVTNGRSEGRRALG